MNKFICMIAAVAAISLSTATAQDLDTVSVADQFNTGERGNITSATAPLDGTEFIDYSGADATGTIRYINTYSGAAGESPVIDVVNYGVSNVDRTSTPTIPIVANPLAGATDGNFAILVGDNGGQNTLSFGESDDSNYFVEVDVYVFDRTAIAGTEISYVAVRASRDAADEPDSATNAGGYSVDRERSYAVAINHHTLQVEAQASQENSASTGYDSLSTPVAITEGWHRIRVEANNTNIVFSVDGTPIASINDAELITGRAALGHRESGVATADEINSVFDNLKAGPAVISNVNEWQLLD